MSSGAIKPLLGETGHNIPNIPRVAAARDRQCCCGNVECIFLQQDNSAFDALEKDLRTAAQLGQALLVRHESYIADVEQERSRYDASLNALDVEKKDLEAKNAKLVEENKALLLQVEGLNNALADSDAQLKSLSATLQSSQHEMQKLNSLTSRAQQLETQLSQLEAEQSQLQATLATTEEERRAIATQWGECQRTVIRLQDQMETIEREARDERQRHAEVVERMRRTRVVEKELESAAGRLKGAAAGKTASHERRTSSVVSSFVKEILEDNARLQLDMVELQEMLIRSTEEVDMLRRQISSCDHPGGDVEVVNQARSLSTELGLVHQPRTISQELHFHHHYHKPGNVSSISGPSRPMITQRPRRRRPGASSGRSTPLTTSHSPTHSSNDIGAHDVETLGSDSSHRSNRWSGISHQSRSSITSSGAGSPPSSYCHSTIFELPLDGEPVEFSRPTSPESNVWSPPMKPSQEDDVTGDSYIHTLSPLSSPELNKIKVPITAIETVSHFQALRDAQEAAQDPLETSTSTLKQTAASQRNPTFLRRTNSTDSLLSISGMDIHSSAPPLRKRPSHLTAIRTSDWQSSGPVLTAASASAIRSSRPSAGADIANARGVLRSSLGNETRDSYAPLQDTLGKKLGGWLSGRWSSGTSMGSSSAELRGRAVSDDVSARSSGAATKKTNQQRADSRDISRQSSGAITTPALRRVKTGRVLVANLDEDSLRECLEIGQGV